MSLMERITADLTQAMKAQEAARLSSLRMVKAALKNEEIEQRAPLSDAAAEQVLQRMWKQRKDSIEQFDSANRPELADKERAELKVIESYMQHAPIDEDTIRTAIEEAIKETGADSPKQMGAVMSKLMARFKGQSIDGKRVQQLVAERLKPS